MSRVAGVYITGTWMALALLATSSTSTAE